MRMPRESACSRLHSAAYKMVADEGVRNSIVWRIVCGQCRRVVECGVSASPSAFAAVESEWEYVPPPNASGK